MAMRDVRSTFQRKLLFRFDPELELIEMKLPSGHIEVINLDDFRPAHRRRVVHQVQRASIDFERIEGVDVDR